MSVERGEVERHGDGAVGFRFPCAVVPVCMAWRRWTGAGEVSRNSLIC